MQGVTSGILRGAGKPKIGAITNLVGYYVIGLPTAVSLMFAAKLGIIGEDRSAADTVTSQVLFEEILRAFLFCCRSVVGNFYVRCLTGHVL